MSGGEAAAPPPEADAHFAAMTLNIANGAGDAFRTAANRARQGGFIARASVDVVGMQEVDIGVSRSGDVDTAAAVASAVVRAPWGIDASYTVALPMSEAGPNLPSGVLDRLARGDLDDDAMADLAAHNEAVRRQRGIEPRSVLVARIRLGTAPSFSILRRTSSPGERTRCGTRSLPPSPPSLAPNGIAARIAW